MKIIIKRFITVFILLIAAIIVFNRAPEYNLEYKYKDGDIRVIIDDSEITRNINKLPQTALLLDGEVLLSEDTIDILFDKNLYYEEKYDTLITTSKEHIAKLKVDSESIVIDGLTYSMNAPTINVKYDYKNDNRYENNAKKNSQEEVIYIPIKALEEVYAITVEFNGKVIITKNNKNRVRITVNAEDNFELKHTNDEFAKNVEIVSAGKYIDIYNYDETQNFIYARSHTGELGYIAKEELLNYEIKYVNIEDEEKEVEKVNIAWDYININSNDISNKVNRKKEEALDVVAPTLLYLKNTNGDITYNVDVARSYLRWAKNQNYRVWVALKNEYADRHFSLEETSEFLNDMKHRENTIEQIIGFAKRNNIEGINIDIEYIYQKDATAFSQFVRELYVMAKKEDIIISVCVNVPDGSPNWSLCYQHNALSEYSDYIALMAYDQYGATSSIAGPNASLEWVDTNINKLVERDGVKSQKILLGIPFYSRLWKSENGVLKSSTIYMNLAKTYMNKNPKPAWLDIAGQYFYENESATIQLWIEENESISRKLDLIEKYNLGGSAYWMLGYETSDIWDTIKEK